ncbi:MAG: MFS transporter, partial [SAR202 cluster bacterium]|nr:MFS transporter [SAR202 cluster bacterium]
MSLVQDPPAAAAAPGAAPVAAPATGAADRPDFPRLSLLAAGHAVTDSYGQSLLSPMFPLIARQMSLSLQEVGGLTTVMGLTASLAQPALGWLSDRYPRICMVALGPFIAAVFIGLVGYA